MTIRAYTPQDLPALRAIWNAIVEQGVAYPQINQLSEVEAEEFFAAQSYCGVSLDAQGGEVTGLYILHPNNVGRCGHIANASYGVGQNARGGGIGEQLVRHSLATAKALGFRILQFNAVVASNAAALHLYDKLGFTRLGVIKEGFLMKDGRYEDIIPLYITLE